MKAILLNQEMRNRGRGFSEIEGKAAKGAASVRGNDASFKTGIKFTSGSHKTRSGKFLTFS
jgi:hypothetical protein